MADKSAIEWTDATWKPVTGCSKISPGCKPCYAERLAKRLRAMGNLRYRNGFAVTLHPDQLNLPLRWHSPRRVFVNSMSDLYHERVPEDFVRRAFDVMVRAEQHIFQILTKRSSRLAKLAPTLAVALAVTVGIVQAGLVPAGGAPVPTPDQILNRILAAQAHAPKTASADAALRLRIHKPMTAAPDCEFGGTLQIEGGRQTLAVNQGSSSFICWVANRAAVGQVFESSQPLEAVLAQFNFHVMGEREVDRHPYYLVQGTARNPSDNVKSLTAWVDYDRGLVTSGTVEYGWGRLDAERRFTRMNGTWILTHQYLYTPKFDASLEIDYTNFRLGPRR